MEQLEKIVKEALQAIDALLDSRFRPEQADEVTRIIEKAVIKGMLEGQHRAVDACIKVPDAEQDMAHKIATAIRYSNDALIANLKSLR